MTFARMPWGPYSFAIVCVRPTTPHLAAQSEPRSAMPSLPAVPEMLTMLPLFCFIICFKTARQQRNTNLRLYKRTSSHSFSPVLTRTDKIS
jgi:hypothetical protein